VLLLGSALRRVAAKSPAAPSAATVAELAEEAHVAAPPTVVPTSHTSVPWPRCGRPVLTWPIVASIVSVRSDADRVWADCSTSTGPPRESPAGNR